MPFGLRLGVEGDDLGRDIPAAEAAALANRDPGPCGVEVPALVGSKGPHQPAARLAHVELPALMLADSLRHRVFTVRPHDHPSDLGAHWDPCLYWPLFSIGPRGASRGAFRCGILPRMGKHLIRTVSGLMVLVGTAALTLSALITLDLVPLRWSVEVLYSLGFAYVVAGLVGLRIAHSL